MKKLLLTLALITIIGLMGCQKEENEPTQPCNCGIITDDGFDGSCYWVEIRNDCSDNIQRFCLSQGDWMNAFPGNDYCITNVDNW
tara:strand:+ start:139 stop:393 length:255 start_codon:yes stop_codon:yes gene_type:complete